MNILIKKSIPNFITLSNLFLGFTAIILLSLSLYKDSYISTACYLILISCGLDTIDGKIARRLNISSEFGKEIDSLADLVSFCIVPSLLLFIHYIKVIPSQENNFILLILLSSFPLILGAIRLAKYNALREMRESQKYLGLPTPANAILVCSMILFVHNIPFRMLVNDSIFYRFLSAIFLDYQWMILNVAIVSSILLMSKVNYDKFPLISFKINRKNTFDLIKVILFLIILFISIYFYYYDLVLLLFIMVYIFGNLIKYIFKKFLKKIRK